MSGSANELEQVLFDTKCPYYTLEDWADLVHQTAVEHGWHDETRTIGDFIALAHSELSEALEEYRNGRNPREIYFVLDKDGREKPEGLPIELMDCVIRILDTLASLGVSPQHAMALKSKYNMGRPHRHGGKAL